MLTQNDMVCGIALPALVGFVIALVGMRKPAAGRFSNGLALVAGFLAGYFALHLGPVQPESHKHWLPLMAVVAWLVEVIRLRWEKTWLTAALVGLFFAGAAWKLVPTWDHLEPSRGVYFPVWSVLSAVLASMLAIRFSSRAEAPRFTMVILVGVAFGAGVLALLADSLRFAQMGIAFGSAMFGMATANFRKREPDFRSLVTPTVLVVCGLLLISRVNTFSEIAWPAWFTTPLALVPLAFLKNGENRRNVVCLVASVGLVCVSIGLGVWAMDASGY